MFLAVGNVVSGTPPVAPPADVARVPVAAAATVAAGDALVFSGGKVEPAAANSTTVAAIALEGGAGASNDSVRIMYNAPGHVYKCPIPTTISNVAVGDSGRRIDVTTMGVADVAQTDGAVNILRIEGGWAWVTLKSPWA